VTDGKPLKREISERWIVLSDDGTDDEDDVSVATGLPQIGNTWTGDNGNTDAGLIVVDVSIADVDESRRKWIVSVTYSSDLPDGSGSSSGGGQSPPNWDPEITWDTELDQYTPEKDLSNQSIVNSAGDLFEPPPVAYRPLLTLRYTRWEVSGGGILDWSSAKAATYVNKVNKDTFIGFTPGQAFMHRIGATSHFIFGGQYWQVTYVIRFRESTWRLRMADRGRQFLPGGTGDPKSFLDEGGGKDIGWLAANGDANTQPRYKSFTIYNEIDFAPLLPGL
jgi:hypothetical protein